MRTTFPKENGDLAPVPKDSPNISENLSAETEQDVSFPKRLKQNGKGRTLATIYKRPDGSYRLYWRDRSPEDGKPRSWFKDFVRYGEAKKAGDGKVSELAKSRQAIRLSPGQASDALAAFQRLQRHFEATGRRVSLLASVSGYCESSEKLGRRTLGEAVDGFLGSVLTVERKDIAKAVDDFISAEEPRTKESNGQRAQLSPKYAYNRAIMLRRFADAFPGTAVSELAKAHLDVFIGGLAEIKSKSRNGKPVSSAKGRNHHRAAIRQFLAWCVRKDFLSATHRLAEADAMRPEHANNGETEFYTPAEFKALLDAGEGPMRAMVAIGGLAGLRTAELLRLTWQDVWRVENHIEVTAGKAKTRQRRLVEIVPALAAWLEPFRAFEQGKVCKLHEITWQQHFVVLCEQARVEIKGKKFPVKRKANGLRHGFCTYHFAAHGNENLTAQQAGNSPAMVHQHYKGLATKKEAGAWFVVSPEPGANIIPFAAAAKKVT